MSYLLMLLCGALTAAPYVFDFLFFLPYFTVAPLIIVTLKKSAPYRHGLTFFLGYYAVVYHWFLYLYPLDFAGFNELGSIAVILVAWLGMSLLQGIGGAFVPMIFKALSKDRHPLFLPFLFASLWCVMEWAQNLFWFGVPWARLALTQYKILPIVQSASLIGSLGVGFIIILIGAFISLAYMHSESLRFAKIYSVVAALIFVFNFAFGTIKLTVRKNEGETLTASVIQANIGSSDKWADNSVEGSLNLYSELSRNAVNESGAKLIVWPETVIITDLNRDEMIIDSICELSRELDAYIAVGSFYVKESDDGYNRYNSVYMFNPDGSMSETVYSKRHLVPFGEYIPAEKVINAVLPFLSEINMLSEPLSEGNESHLFTTEFGKIGSLICFDSIYDSLSRESVRDGAELLILSTNDSWYKDSASVYQHNAHAVLRAIENGRCIVRAANTGVSSIISDEGVVLTEIGPLKQGYTSETVNISGRKTVYNLIGNSMVYMSIAYIALLSALKIKDRYEKKYCEKNDFNV